MKKLLSLCCAILLALAIFTVTGCGGGGGGSSSPDSGLSDIIETTPEPDPGDSGDPDAGIPAGIALASSLPAGTELSQGGEATITATVRDSGGALVPDGTPVSFEADLGSITDSDVTVTGVATATYQAGAAGGTVTITAESGDASDDLSFDIAAGSAASIVKKSVTPETIGVLGAGVEDTAQITFEVRDDTGAPAPDGTIVDFTIQVPLGGESLSADSATSAGGTVTVALQSGNVPGTVTVVADIFDPNDATVLIASTEARVTIVSNRPDAGRIITAASVLNLAGGVRLGLQSTISAYLGDRSGNVVPDGTPVSFISECGTIGESDGFNATTTFGVASAVLQTSSPLPPGLGGIDGSGNVGLCRVVAYTPGKGTFIDNNGNGLFDAGDQCLTTLDEPYIDANDNGSFDIDEEYYVDVNGDESFTADVVDCQSDSMIWTSMNVLISDNVGDMNLSPDSFSLAVGESQTFTVDFQDLHGNALVAGTTFEVTTTAGTLAGVTSFTQADTTGLGSTVSFSLMADTDPAADQEFAEITVTIGSAPGENNNGAEVFTIASGPINMPPPAAPPEVLFTFPGDGQADVDPAGALLIIFSEAMAPATVNQSTVFLERVSDGFDVPLEDPTEADGTEFTFAPTAPLDAATAYRLTVRANVADADFTQKGSATVITFTTR